MTDQNRGGFCGGHVCTGVARLLSMTPATVEGNSYGYPFR